MNKAKVLLVESSAIVLQIEKRYLRAEGSSVTAVGDAEEAFAAARRLRPDLIYLSFSLPGMDGAACCKEMKSDPELENIPIILVANAVEEEMEICRAAGCDAVITKPLGRRAFLEAGRTLLARVRRREERVPCRATVACSLNGATFYGTIEDVSLAGMFVGSLWEVAPGNLLTMKFVLPWSGATLIETTARVAWLNVGKPRRHLRYPHGFGVVFERLGSGNEDQIKDYLELVRMRLTPPR